MSGSSFPSFSAKTDLKTHFFSKLPHATLYDTGVPSKYGTGGKTWEGHLAAMDGLVHQAKGANADARFGFGDTFPYIQYSQQDFVEHVTPLLKNVNSFIDVGCGAGDKLKIVRDAFPHINVYGVEHTPAMATWAGEYGTVFCVDAFRLDYINYDVIYAYWPIANIELMKKLAGHIISTKRDSARFILVGFPEKVEGMLRNEYRYQVQYA